MKKIKEGQELTEVYCSKCGELKTIEQRKLKKYKKCVFCDSTDINEA
jgi:hypothetical protein